MKKLCVIPLDFRPGPDGAVPVDQSLHELAVEYCRANLVEVPNFTMYQKTYVVAELDDAGEVLQIHTVSCGRPVFDIPVIRATGPFAKQCLALVGDRWNSYLADRGFRGEEVLIYIDAEEKPEQKCENQQGTIEAFNLKPSKRMAGKVR